VNRLKLLPKVKPHSQPWRQQGQGGSYDPHPFLQSEKCGFAVWEDLRGVQSDIGPEIMIEPQVARLKLLAEENKHLTAVVLLLELRIQSVHQLYFCNILELAYVDVSRGT